MSRIYDEIAESILDQLKAGVAPWRRPWDSTGGFPKNLYRKAAYRGINIWLLLRKGYASPYWVSFRQAQQMGGTVRKGERGTRIVVWNESTRKAQAQDADERYIFVSMRSVFNILQCDGIENPAPDTPEFEPVAAAEALVAAMPQRPPIFHDSDYAYYLPLLDELHMPPRKQFRSAAGYYATLFHELGHSTGHPSRLDRPDFLHFEVKPYSFEELVAELTAAMLCGVTGIAPAIIENSASYLAGWMKALENDRRLFLSAAAQAQRAADFIQAVPASSNP